MEQLEFALLGRINGPAVAPTQYVNRCSTYREAVRLCWHLRRVRKMTHRQLAAEGEFHAQHVGDWLNPDDKPKRRNLPGNCIERFEAVAGNTLVTQWLASRAHLTLLEEMQATRAA